MAKVESKAVKIPIKKTEEIKKILQKKNKIDLNLKIKKDRIFSYIPIKGQIKNQDFEIIKTKFEKNRKKIRSYKKQKDVPVKIRDNLPSSFDIIGEIGLIKIPNELMVYKKDIGKAILKTYKNIKTVCVINPVSGEYRIRDIEIVAGLNKTETVHKEFGLNFYIDVKKCYFSPRLANERKRISDLVKNNEIIVDMFTGVAPFPIIISKYANPKLIYAIDKNKDCLSNAKKNVRLNKFTEKIILFNRDANNIRTIIPKTVEVDRIIMNLPFSSYDFFTNAVSLCKNVLFIHYYEIINKNEIENRKKNLKKIAKKQNVILKNIKIQKIKSYSPREFYICFDITAKKKYYADVA